VETTHTHPHTHMRIHTNTQSHTHTHTHTHAYNNSLNIPHLYPPPCLPFLSPFLAPWTAYGRSKSCNILFTQELAKRYRTQNLIACAVHPGVIPTELGRNNVFASLFYGVGKLFMKNIAQGAATTVYCTTAPEILAESPDDWLHAADGNGRYYADCNLAHPKGHITEESAARLWDVSMELAGLNEAAAGSQNTEAEVELEVEESG
jgi:NAD(P)-dependent dehydrogenase (short-subunit alcohol dehydrogenase family)